MDDVSKTKIDAAFKEYFDETQEISVLAAVSKVKLMFECGAGMKIEFDTGKYKTIKGAAAPCMTYVEKEYDLVYGEQWWREAYYSATKLTKSDRAYLLKTRALQYQVKHIVQKNKDEAKKLMQQLRSGKDIFPARPVPKKRGRKRGKSALDLEIVPDLDQTLVLPEEWDEDAFINTLSCYLSKFSHVAKDQRYKAVQEVIMRTGLKP